MTERALKSTRFPIKLPLSLPCLPFSLVLISLYGLPERCPFATITLLVLLSTWVAT